MRRLSLAGLIVASLGVAVALPEASAQTVEVRDGKIILGVAQPFGMTWGADGKSLTVYWGGVSPTPTPEPAPNPVPPPVPLPPAPTPAPADIPAISGTAWAMAIYDKAAAPTYVPPDGHTYAKNREIVVTVRDVSDPTAVSWLTSQGLSAPAIVIIGRDGDQLGKPLYSASMPRSEAEFRNLIDALKPPKPGR